MSRSQGGPNAGSCAASRWHPVWGDRGWLPESVRVVRGDWSFDVGADGISRVAHQGVEIAARIYLGVRDLSWNTVRGRMDGLGVTGADDGRAAWVVDVDDGVRSLTSAWSAQAEDAETLVLRVVVTPRRSFLAAKLGLCVTHSQTTAVGARYDAWGAEQPSSGTLSGSIHPQHLVDGVLTAMFPAFQNLRLRFPATGIDATFSFAGDLYEMQDHRNWADADFKTYSTPQALGGPWRYQEGDELERELRIRLRGLPAHHPPPARPEAPTIAHLADVDPGHAFAASTSIDHLSLARLPAATLDLIRALAPRRLRLELSRELDADARGALQRMVSELGATADLVVAARDAHHARAIIDSLGPSVPVASVMVIGVGEDGAPVEVTDVASDGMAGSGDQDAPTRPEIVAGTGQFFCQINRGRPALGESRRLAFGVAPQVHACDARSIIANLRAVQAIAASARTVYGPDVRLDASPTRFVPVQGPYHTGHVPRAASAPPVMDARLAGTFGAAWLVGMVHRLVIAGFSSAALLDAIGPNGLIVTPGHATGALPRGALVLPAFHVLRVILGAQDLRGVHARDHADEVAAILVRGAGRRQLLVASLAEEALSLDISGLTTGHRLRWALTERSVERAMVDPLGWEGIGDQLPAGESIRMEAHSVLLTDLDPDREP